VIVYLDASALVKRYVAETGSAAVAGLIEQVAVVGTSILSRAEVAAALAKAVRMKVVPRRQAEAALQAFGEDWESFVRLQATEVLVARAARLAWNHGLRGYDAAHLAAALLWHEMMGESVTLATYDRQLWDAAGAVGLVAWPERLP
jgi:predicted nucleic acid-binding protein